MKKVKKKVLVGFKQKTVKFNFENINRDLVIPHVGWNTVVFKKKHTILSDFKEETRFYFSHSFHTKCDNKKDVLMEAKYGYYFTAAFHNNNILGVQFHPEKSHKFGLKLLKNFVELI